MLFKGFSIFSSGSNFVQPSGTILAILVERDKRNISEKYFEIGPLAKEMLFEDFFYFWLWQPSCSMERNSLSNFSKGP